MNASSLDQRQTSSPTNSVVSVGRHLPRADDRPSAGRGVDGIRLRRGCRWMVACFCLAIAKPAVATTGSPAAAASLVPSSSATDLSDVVNLMRAAQGQLVGDRLGQDQVELQTRIVKRLEELLDGLTHSSERGGSRSAVAASGAGGPKASPANQLQNRAMQDSAAVQTTSDSHAGDSTSTERVDPTSVPALWGRLPPQTRRNLEGTFPPSFLPEFESQIRAYYRHLTEEQAFER